MSFSRNDIDGEKSACIILVEMEQIEYVKSKYAKWNLLSNCRMCMYSGMVKSSKAS